MKEKEILKESKEFKLLFEKSLNLLNGKYSSKIKGDGIEFVDLKEYVPGDDIRKIDWKVTAREGKVFVKEFQEEKDASHYILIDTSLSQKTKLRFVKVLATSLLLSSMKFRNSFSIVFFNKNNIEFFPLSKNKSTLMKYVYNISKIKLESLGNLKNVLLSLLSIVNKKSIISIISDEMIFDRKINSLLRVVARKHKLNYFFIYSSNEKNLELGLNSYEDIESGFSSIYDLDEEELEEYKLKFEEQIEAVNKNLLSLGIKPLILDSDSDLTKQFKFNGGLI